MKKYKASILAVTLIVLSIILIMALSVSVVALKQRSASLGSGKSNQAFQNADKGVEEIMDKIARNPGIAIGSLDASKWTCSVEGIYAVLKSSAGQYQVVLKKSVDTEATDCSTIAQDIASIKSTGFGADQESRAVEAAVASVMPIFYEAGNDDSSCTLTSDNSWHDFCDLTLNFTTTKTSSIIQVFYKISTYRNAGIDNHLITSIVVDGSEVKSGRAITGQTTFWSNDGSWIGTVGAGNHNVLIRYRTPAPGITISAPNSSDWQTKKLQVAVF